MKEIEEQIKKAFDSGASGHQIEGYNWDKARKACTEVAVKYAIEQLNRLPDDMYGDKKKSIKELETLLQQINK